MSETPLPHQPPPSEPTPRWCLAVGALGIAAVLLGAVIAQQRAEAAPAGTDTSFGARAALLRCPPNACNHPDQRPPTTTAPVTTVWIRPTTTRPPATTQPPTTTRRPFIIIFPPCFPNCSAPTTTPPTTTARPAPTTTRRPPPTTTRRPVTTTTRRPVTTTTRRPTPTTARPALTTTQATDDDPGCESWACDEIDSGVQNGYLPQDYEPNRPTQSSELIQVLSSYGEHNPDFDADAALEALPDRGLVDRGDMFIAIAIGIGLDVDPDGDPFEVADELADMGILLGHDGDGDGVTNPYSRPDADPDSTMSNAQLAAFLDRIPIDPDQGDSYRPPDRGSPPDPDPDDEDMCTTGLVLSAADRSLFVSQLSWHTLVGIEPEGEPGRPWPPHAEVPGGSEFLVVSGSPVWPVIDPGALWYVASDDGCYWEAITVQTRLTQLLPWRTSHRSTIDNAHASRPDAGFDTYLRRWDNLTAVQQSQAQQYHRNRDVSASCGVATAMIAADAYDRCRWQLPTPGVWAWQARACFEGVGVDATFHGCATLAGGVEWFREIIDYTSGITLQHDPDTLPDAEHRRPAPGR